VDDLKPAKQLVRTAPKLYSAKRSEKSPKSEAQGEREEKGGEKKRGGELTTPRDAHQEDDKAEE